jgi:aminoglycoside phosphotransferase (APT) family kinase protein
MVKAIGSRIEWAVLPPAVRSRVEQVIGGGPVISAQSQAGGFSPGTADRVRTADGRRAFVKAVSPRLNERSAELACQEIRVTAALPPSAPVPRFLGGFEEDDWVVLIIEDVEGAPPRTPWVESEIDAAATGLRELAAALTPAPLTGVPTAAELMAHDFGGWDRLAAEPMADLDPWAADHLDALRAASELGLAAVANGSTLTHNDIRADNILVRPDGRAIFVDWPWGSIGPAWLDTVLLAINIEVYGGDGARVVRELDQRVVTGVVAGLCGGFTEGSRLPPPPGIPALRAFMRFQGDGMLRWLRTHLD